MKNVVDQVGLWVCLWRTVSTFSWCSPAHCEQHHSWGFLSYWRRQSSLTAGEQARKPGCTPFCSLFSWLWIWGLRPHLGWCPYNKERWPGIASQINSSFPGLRLSGFCHSNGHGTEAMAFTRFSSCHPSLSQSENKQVPFYAARD